jgi:sulfatase maturation enzyme AslB (radical SAM superfamily)
MTVWPLKFRAQDDGGLFFTNDAGGFFVSDEAFLARYVTNSLTAADLSFLQTEGHAFEHAGDLAHTAFSHRWAARQNARRDLSYVILVPTLRCNLACTYCQVSRAAQTALGYDWTDEVVAHVIGFLDRLDIQEIKVEFQGGEPMLRTDLLHAIRNFCRSRFQRAEFVVCTNLQVLGPQQLTFLEDSDTFVSTSIDGSTEEHNRNRTQDPKLARAFFANLKTLVYRFGSARLSALPTIDMRKPPDFDSLIDTYEALGLKSVYLRPVNYQGFARRTPPSGN